jgi:hypothetical protein
MEELYVEGLASHDDPESCAGVRKGAGEALTGAHAGGAIEPRNVLSPGCRRRVPERKATSPSASSRAGGGPRAVGELVHAWNLQAREPGDPMAARAGDRRAGRSGKAEAVRLR